MIHDRTHARAADYERDFGAVPEFRTGLHGGTVVAGECGDEKQEIVYFGDTVNTASRIQGQCKELGAPLLISRGLLDQMELPAHYRAESLGNVLLRGRDSEMELFRIERAGS
jgi:adenylate cyclase